MKVWSGDAKVGHVEIEAVWKHHDMDFSGMHLEEVFVSFSFDSVDSTTSTWLPLMSPRSQGILRAAAPRCGRPAGPGGDLRALPWLVDGLRDSFHRGGCLAVKSTPPGRGWLCFLALWDFVFSGLACIFWRKEGQSSPNMWVNFL